MTKNLIPLLALAAFCCFALTATARPEAEVHPTPQRPLYGKLSPMLRHMVRQQQATPAAARPCRRPSVCALVKVAPGGEEVMQQQGCRLLAQVGDICIADIPKAKLGPLTRSSNILRIEANRSSHALTDGLADHLNATPAYQGLALPQAYTGQGVVVGVMDIGFDLTHPNFYSRDTTQYRISRFWDMLAADTVDSPLYVGRDYAGRDELLAVAHARDGLDHSHGTHTLGIAAGSGYDSPYRGLAPESDICIVANAVTEDTIYIDPDDYDKYTFATDALGFKYIFDYAESQGKPCVINFSEGSLQDFWGYDQLYYEMLSRLTGPGRIIVAAAGNYGNDKTWFCKPRGQHAAGTFLRASGRREGMFTLKADSPFDLQVVAYGNGGNDTLTVGSSSVVQQPDSTFTARLYTASPTDSVLVSIVAYPSCYVPTETCYDVTLTGSKKSVGVSPKISFEVTGEEATVEAYRVTGDFAEDALNPQLNAGEQVRSILSPASAPGVICVGSTFYRDGITNYKGEWKGYKNGPRGERQFNSAIGPTYDGRIKPDVMAPGLHIISSYSSYFMEQHPTASDIDWDVAHFTFNGRTYAWNCNSGTSMASPAVAGAIALWLQAKPDLTTEEAMEVFSHTCRHYDETLTYPNNYVGHGEIDVYRGLLHLLGVEAIADISQTQTSARVTLGSGRLNIDLGAAPHSPVNVRLYALSGRKVLEAGLTPGLPAHTLTLPHLDPGVYVVQIDGAEGVGGSTLVRL